LSLHVPIINPLRTKPVERLNLNDRTYRLSAVFYISEGRSHFFSHTNVYSRWILYDGIKKNGRNAWHSQKEYESTNYIICRAVYRLTAELGTEPAVDVQVSDVAGPDAPIDSDLHTESNTPIVFDVHAEADVPVESNVHADADMPVESVLHTEADVPVESNIHAEADLPEESNVPIENVDEMPVESEVSKENVDETFEDNSEPQEADHALPHGNSQQSVPRRNVTRRYPAGVSLPRVSTRGRQPRCHECKQPLDRGSQQLVACRIAPITGFRMQHWFHATPECTAGHLSAKESAEFASQLKSRQEIKRLLETEQEKGN
jgi:hypothetical protein